MRLIKHAEEDKDTALFRVAMRCGLIAVVAHNTSTRVGDMQIGWNSETQTAYYNSDLIQTIKAEEASSALYQEPATEETLNGFASVMVATDKDGLVESEAIGMTVCVAFTPRPMLTTVMGQWNLNRDYRHWYAYQLGVVNEIQDKSENIIEGIATALLEHKSLGGEQIEQIIADLEGD
jgi:hypothetical protein